MATAHRAKGFSFVVRSRDHAPAHVHVWKGKDWARVTIPAKAEKALVQENWGLKTQELHWAVNEVETHAAKMMRKWKEVHGEK